MNIKERIYRIQWNKGNSEATAFAAISIMFCVIFMALVGVFQLTAISNQLTQAIETIARSVALCRTENDAIKEANNIVSLTVTSPYIEMTESPVTIDYTDSNEVWKQGASVVVSLNANVTTWLPSVQNREMSKSVVVTIEGRKSNGSTSEVVEAVIDRYQEKGWTDEAIAAMLGNMKAESGLATNNLENWMNTILGVTDEEYTEMINSGKITPHEFGIDYSPNAKQWGYGLIGFTSAGLKQLLWDNTIGVGLDIDDIEGQLNAIDEYYPASKFTYMSTKTDINEAAKAYYYIFEMGNSISAYVNGNANGYGYESSIPTRQQYAMEIYEQYF